MNRDALQFFMANLTREQDSFGYAPQALAQWLSERLSEAGREALDSQAQSRLPTQPVTRDHVFDLIADTRVSALACVIGILAWGGVRRSNALLALQQPMTWVNICEGIRSGAIDRQAAYDLFREAKRTSALQGIGPAFFTKFIFFFMGRRPASGYIMDQWTARSVNLIFGRPVVITRGIGSQSARMPSQIVCDSNTSANYEAFCECVEWLADEAGVSPEEAELSLFSEGRGKGAWRSYVVGRHQARAA